MDHNPSPISPSFIPAGIRLSACDRSFTSKDQSAWLRPIARTRAGPSAQLIKSRFMLRNAAHSVSRPEIPAALAFW